MDALAFGPGRKRGIHAPSQPWLMHRKARDQPSADMRLDAAGGGFDFGQFTSKKPASAAGSSRTKPA
jgi:hypothetical protein